MEWNKKHLTRLTEKFRKKNLCLERRRKFHSRERTTYGYLENILFIL